MSGLANPVPITEALQAAQQAQGPAAAGKIEPADLTHVNAMDYLQPATPTQESAFISLADPAAHNSSVHAATPQLRADAPTEPNQILNDLGSSLEQTSNVLSQLQIPDMPTKQPIFPESTPGKPFDAKAFEKLNDQMMAEQRELFNSVFQADERLQSATLGETMIANSATQTEKSMKQLLNGQG